MPPASSDAHQDRSCCCSRGSPAPLRRASFNPSRPMECTGINLPSLLESGPHPECPEDGQGHQEHKNARRDADVAVAVSVVDCVVAAQVPHQQRKNGDTSGCEEGEECRREGEEQTGEQAEPGQRKSEECS